MQQLHKHITGVSLSHTVQNQGGVIMWDPLSSRDAPGGGPDPLPCLHGMHQEEVQDPPYGLEMNLVGSMLDSGELTLCCGS